MMSEKEFKASSDISTAELPNTTLTDDKAPKKTNEQFYKG